MWVRVWRHRSPECRRLEGRSSPPRPLPDDLTSWIWVLHPPQLSHPAAKSVLPKGGTVPEALDLGAVQPGAESLTPIPEPVAKPQLPEGHVSPPPPAPSSHALCHVWPPPKDPSLSNRTLLQQDQVPGSLGLGYSSCLYFQFAHPRSSHCLGLGYPLPPVGPALFHRGPTNSADTAYCPLWPLSSPLCPPAWTPLL